MRAEIVEVRAAGALPSAAALAEHPDVQKGSVQLRIELERVLQRRLRVRGAADAVVGDAEVIGGVGAQRGMFVGPDLLEVRDGLRLLVLPQVRQSAVEPRRLQLRLDREGTVERRDRLRGLAVQQQRQPAQVLDLRG